MTDLTVANTIAAQIGREAFLLMGTRHKLGDENSLTFDVKGSRRVNKIKIIYNREWMIIQSSITGFVGQR